MRCLSHRRHPGRRPGIHCRGRWAMRLTACGSARAFGRWIPGRRFASPGMTVHWSSPSLSSRAKTRDPLPRSMVDEAYGLRIGPGVRPLDPGSALRFARDDGALFPPSLSSRAKTRDPLPRSMGDEAYGLRIGPGVWPMDPGSALRFARDDSSLSSPSLSSRAKTRDPLPRSMGDEAHGLRIGPGVRPLDPGSALRFARDDRALSVPIAVIPGRIKFVTGCDAATRARSLPGPVLYPVFLRPAATPLMEMRIPRWIFSSDCPARKRRIRSTCRWLSGVM